jgi:DNA primase
LDKSKRAVLDAGFAVVCEGQLDLIACHMAGVHNVVAPQGTAFTTDHARIIKRYVDEVVLCFDSDEAGQAAAVRSLDSLLASGLAIRVAVFPAPHDPDSFIKEFGAVAFRKLVEGAEGFFDYLLNRLCATNEVTTDKGRLAVLRGMAEAVRRTGNGVLIDKYAQKTALRLGVSPDAMRSEFKKIPTVRNARAGGDAEPDEPPPESSRPSPHEFWLLKLVLRHEECVDWAAAHLDPKWIQHDTIRQMISRRLAAHTGHAWHGLAAFLGEFESAEAQGLMTEATADDRTIPDPARQLTDVVTRLRNQFIDQQLAALTHRSNLSETSEAERLDLLVQQQQLRLLKRQPIEPLPGRE